MLSETQINTLTSLTPDQRQGIRKRLVKEGRYTDAMEVMKFCSELENAQSLAGWLEKNGAIEVK